MSSQNFERGARGVEQRPFRLPLGSTELVVVRHGASAVAVEGSPFELVDGRGDPPLSEDGERQAASVCARLEREPFDRLFVTPLQRTVQSAAPLASARGVEPEVVSELIEVDLGEWGDGQYRIRAADQDPLFLRVHEEERWELIPGAEPADEFTRRVHAGMDAVVEATGPDRVAVVFGHGAVIGEACRRATASRPFAFIHADNGSISRLVRQPDGSWLLRSFNDVTHLAVLTGPAG